MRSLYLGQVIIPLALIAWIALAPPASRVGFWLQAVATSIAFFALNQTGLWLFPPWWAPFVYGLLLLGGIAIGFWRVKRRSIVPRGFVPWMSAALFGVLAVFSANEVIHATAGSYAPEGVVVDLAFPLGQGRYLIANGGNDLRINAHQKSMISSDPRFKPWRGNGYGVDIVGIDKFGLRASGLLPGDPSAYQIFSMPVVAPCAGTVVIAVDGVPDMTVPEFDHNNMAGNHVVLACGDVHVVMAHLREDSTIVRAGDEIATGDNLGEVGNSGGSNEPHLHIHAQRPGPVDAPIGGDPLPVTFDGRFLVRGDRITLR